MAKVQPGYERVKCGRCKGTGHVRGFEHYANGVCFDCKGAGTHDVSLATVAANRKPRAQVIREIKRILDSMKVTAEETGNAFERSGDEYSMGWILAHADKDVYDRAILALKRLEVPSRGYTDSALAFIERCRVDEETIIKSGRRRTYGRRDPQRKHRKIPAGSLKRGRRSRR